MRKIITIDCDYLHPEFAASYLIVEGEHAAFVDNNTAHSVPLLLKALRKEGLRPEQVEYVIITHVHLDHAGGTGVLMEECVNSTLLAHPKAAHHMVRPDKLVASATQVYGEETFQKLYGEIRPVPRARVKEIQDGEEVGLGSGKLAFFHTRGHANHHFCVYDAMTSSVFTGDSFGVIYPALQKNGTFAFASTSPTDFDAWEARNSIQRILDCGAERAFPTHFGEQRDLQGVAKQLREDLDFSEALLEDAVRSGVKDRELYEFCASRLQTHFRRRLGEVGLDQDTKSWELLRLDLELNAAGIAHVARKRKSTSTAGS